MLQTWTPQINKQMNDFCCEGLVFKKLNGGICIYIPLLHFSCLYASFNMVLLHVFNSKHSFLFWRCAETKSFSSVEYLKNKRAKLVYTIISVGWRKEAYGKEGSGLLCIYLYKSMNNRSSKWSYYIWIRWNNSLGI